MTWENVAKKSERELEKFIARKAVELRQGVENLFCSRITISVCDREQFYRLVHYCNKNYGRGRNCWTVRGRVLRFVDLGRSTYDPPATKEWVVKQVNLDLTHLLHL